MSSKIQITNKQENGDILTFTISNIDVCFVNALRRTIITNIPVIAFNNKNCIIYKNTIAGVTNEYIKHRLSGIPIHIKNTKEFPIQNYIMELDIENDTDATILVTSKDFKIKNINTNKYLSEQETEQIFPSNVLTNNYILFLILKPQLATNIPGESIKLSCNFTYEQSGTDGMYSASCLCSFLNTVDMPLMKKELEKVKQLWREEKMPAEMLEINASNWEKTTGARICKTDCFDFKLETIGVYSNKELLGLACDYLIEKLIEISKNMETYFKIKISESTLLNSFDVIFNNNNKEIDEWTFGNILKHQMFEMYYSKDNIITSVGIKKNHPEDEYIVLRISYKEVTENTTLLMHLNECLLVAKDIFNDIKKLL